MMKQTKKTKIENNQNKIIDFSTKKYVGAFVVACEKLLMQT